MSKKIRSKPLKVVCIFIIVLPFLSGCWDRIEIEERATVLAIGIDKTEIEEEEEEMVTHLKDDSAKEKYGDYKVTVQIAVPGRLPLGPGTGMGGGGDERPVWILESKGHTMSDAITNLQQEISSRIFLGHLRIIVVSEEVAREGLREIGDYLRRNSEVRRAAWLIVSKEDASKYVKAQPELERVAAIYLLATMDQAVRLGKLPNNFIGTFWSTLSSKGQDPYLPYVELKKEDNIKISGLAYFKNDQMVGATTPIQIGHFMGIMQMNPGGYKVLVTVPDVNETVVFESVQRKSKLRIDIKDGIPHARVQVYIEGDITESSNDYKITTTKVIEQLEDVLPKDANVRYSKLVKETQEAGSDIFGFGEYVRAKHPTYWNTQVKTRERWNELYKEMPVDINVTYNFRRIGMKAR